MKVTLKCSYSTGTPRHTGVKDGKPFNIKGDRKDYVAGDVIDLVKEEAERLIAAGDAVAGAVSAAEPAAPKKPTGKALVAAVADAIGGLDPLDEYVNKADKPFVAAIEKILGYDITEADRDAGWDAFKSANPDLFKAGGAAA